MILKKELSKAFWEKGENAGEQKFLLFPRCFYPSKMEFKYSSHVCRLQIPSIWISLKFSCLVNDLKQNCLLLQTFVQTADV